MVLNCKMVAGSWLLVAALNDGGLLNLRIQDAGYRLQDAGCKMQHARCQNLRGFIMKLLLTIATCKTPEVLRNLVLFTTTDRVFDRCRGTKCKSLLHFPFSIYMLEERDVRCFKCLSV